MHEVGVVFNLAMHAPKKLKKMAEGEEVSPATRSEMKGKKWWGDSDDGEHDS